MSGSLRFPSRGLGAGLAGGLALLVAVLAALCLVPQAKAAFSISQCQGTDVLGRGASFAQAAHGAWEVPFRNNFCGGSGPDIQYDPAGSGAGITGMKLRGATDPRFGGTDDPLNTTQKNEIQAGTAAEGDEGKIHQVPIAVGAVAPLVNFPDNCDVSLLPEASRTAEQNVDGDGTPDDVIRVRFNKTQFEAVWAQGASGAPYVDWDDVFPALATDADCGKPVIRVVRFDNSGTTFAFKDFLSRVNGARGWVTTFQEGTNGNREWPGAEFGTGSFQGCGSAAPGKQDDALDHLTSGCANGNGALVPKLIATDGSIGYSDIATARTASPSLAITPEGNDNDTYWTQLENGSATFTEPTADPNGFRATDGARGSNCASTVFTGVPANTLADWAAASGVNSNVGYGICTLTYGLVWDDNADVYGVSGLEEERARTVKDYFAFVTSDAGQLLLSANDYIELPPAIQAIAQAGIAAVDYNKGSGGENPDPVDPNGTPKPPVTPVTPVQPPSNAFSVTKKAISSKDGKATISVKLPGPGKVVMVGQAKSGKKAVQVGKVTLNATKSGTFKLTLKPSSAAKKLLEEKGSLKVDLKITFTPTGGTAKASNSAVMLKLSSTK